MAKKDDVTTRGATIQEVTGNAPDPAPKSAPEPAVPAGTSASGDGGVASVQAEFDAAHAKGFFGESTDPTPNANYTLKGVIAGKPTPETHYDAAVEALKVRVAGAEGVQPPT